MITFKYLYNRLSIKMLTTKEIGKFKKKLQGGEDHLAFIFEALSNPARLKIFRLLSKQKDICVTDVARILGVSVPAASYQFRILEMVGLVEKERMGKMICYKLKKENPIVRKIIRIVG